MGVKLHLAIALTLLGGCEPTGKTVFPGVDDAVRAVVYPAYRVWEGPRVPEPAEQERPRGAQLALRSATAQVAVHVDSADGARVAAVALDALEEAQRDLDAAGWPLPIADGAVDGTDFDLYLRHDGPAAAAHVDRMVDWSYLDRATTFATVRADLPEPELQACVRRAYAEAMLLAMDPAEAPQWRRATASWLTWEADGSPACDDGIAAGQQAPQRGWVSASEEPQAGALLLALVAARHDGGDGAFVRGLWELASQRTWDGQGLRASPDLWEALDAAITAAGDDLLENIQAFAVARYYVGHPGVDAVVQGLDERHRVKVAWRGELGSAAKRVSSRQALQPFGSVYLVAKLPQARGRLVNVWLDGEYGVRWSLIALSLDTEGREVGRLAAPITDRRPKAFLPVALDDRAASLVLIVTNLSSRLPDADHADANERSARVTLAVASP